MTGSRVRLTNPLWKAQVKTLNRVGICVAVSKYGDVALVQYPGNKKPVRVYIKSLTVISDKNQIIRESDYGC